MSDKAQHISAKLKSSTNRVGRGLAPAENLYDPAGRGLAPAENLHDLIGRGLARAEVLRIP